MLDCVRAFLLIFLAATVYLPAAIALQADQVQPDSKPVQRVFNATDPIFRDARDSNFSIIGPFLTKKAQEAKAFEDSRHGADIARLGAFVKQMKSHQEFLAALRVHINLTQHIRGITSSQEFFKELETQRSEHAYTPAHTKARTLPCECDAFAGFLLGTDNELDYVEELIYKQESFEKVLRLLCLASLCNGGLKKKVFESLRSDVLQTYGYEFFTTLLNLEKAGLFKAQDGTKNNLPALRKQLQLFKPDVSEDAPDDISYVFSGYAPISVRLLERVFLTGNWPVEHELCAGPVFEESQQLPVGIEVQRTPDRKPVTMIFFVGGVTFAEIAAIRFLNSKIESQEFVIATTKIVNGKSLIRTFVEEFDN